MADFYVNPQGIASTGAPAFDPNIEATRARIAADKASRLSAIENAPLNAPPSVGIDAPPVTTSTSLASRAGDLASRTIQGWAGKLSGAEQLFKGGYGLAANAGMVTPNRGYEKKSNVDNSIRTVVGAGSFTPGIAQFARPVAVGMAASDMIPDAVYNWGLNKLGLLPQSGVRVNPDALGGKTPEQVIAEHTATAPTIPRSTQGELMTPAAPDNAPAPVDTTGVPAQGSGWITNNQTGKTTAIGAPPRGISTPPTVSMPVTPQAPQLTAPTMPVLSTSGGIMGAMAGLVNQVGKTGNLISANNTANKDFKNQIAAKQQADSSAKTAADLRNAGIQEQAGEIDLAQKRRVNALQGEYMTASPERQKQIAKELALYTGKDPSSRNLERVRSTMHDNSGNPVGIDYLYDRDSGQWLTPPSSAQGQQQIPDGLRIDPQTGKMIKVVNGAATIVN